MSRGRFVPRAKKRVRADARAIHERKLLEEYARSDPKIHVPDDTALVDTTVELDDDLTRSVVINELELVDVTYRAPRIYRQCPRISRLIVAARV